MSKLNRRDYLLLSAYCVLLFGYICVSGRPMTLHEAREPETAREMMARGDWLVPMSGDRPWLERPPFPHWVQMTVATLLGQHCNNEWSARIPPALMGLLIVLMTARIGGMWFGRSVGLLSGFALASMYEFYYYSTLAEDDIFLAFLVVGAIAAFVEMEFFRDARGEDKRLNPVGWRPWPVALFFILLGMTNLAKGPLVGAAVVIGPIGVWLVLMRFWTGNWRRMRRYLWVWGILAAAAIGLSWHLYMVHLFPGDYLANLKYDFSATHDFDIPHWYYLVQLPGVGMPWVIVGMVSLVAAIPVLIYTPDLPMRFLACWAVVPIVVLSLPHRGHHHYLVPSLAPWAIWAALGLRPIARHMFRGSELTRKVWYGVLVYGVPGAAAIAVALYMGRHKVVEPAWVGVFLVCAWLGCVAVFYHGLWVKDGRFLMGAVVVGVGITYCWGQTYWPDETVQDTKFLKWVDATVPADKLLAVNAGDDSLEFFRLQFYLRDDAVLVHNLTYLRSTKLGKYSDAYVVARAGEEGPLKALAQGGTVTIKGVSAHTRRERSPNDRWTLFYVTFPDDMPRFDPKPITTMQAMLRKPGPDLGPPLPAPNFTVPAASGEE